MRRLPSLIVLGLICVGLASCRGSQFGVDPYDDMKGAGANQEDAVPATGDDVESFAEISARHESDIPRDIVAKYYDIIGPSAMLDVVERESYCHDKAHNIGKEVFVREGGISKAMSICKQRCSSGCFHGILMQKFGDLRGQADNEDHIDLADLEQEITQICHDASISESIGLGDCVHGVGHAVAFMADYIMPVALDACALYEDPALEYYCATGAYMERDIVYGEADKNEASELYPCDETRDHPAACYRYKIRRSFRPNVDNIPMIKSLCDALPSKQERSGCYHGLGMAYFKWIRKSPQELPNLCRSQDALSEQLCIEAAIGKLRVYDSKKSMEACTFYDGAMAEVCRQAYQTGNFGMSKDFSLYYYRAPR